MSNLLNFKFGQYANLPVGTTAGNVYVTTDEKAMYVDLPNKEGTVERLRIGDIVVKNSVRDAKPPFYADAFYYFIEENALLRWNATGGETGTGAWVQINSRSDLESDLDSLVTRVDNLTTSVSNNTQAIADNKAAADQSIENLNTAVGKKLETADFEAFEITNTEAIADAKKAGTDANTAAGTAQAKADSAYTLAEEAKTLAGTKATLADVAAVGYALDVDAQRYASDVLGTSEDVAGTATVHGALKSAAAASSAASAAQTKADDAYTLAGQKTTMAEVEAKDYATKAQAQGYVDTLKGASTDVAGTATVHGALKAAAAASTAASDAAGAASAAQSKADSAYTLADENKGKIESIQNAGYITIAPVNSLETKLTGTEGDTTGVTIQRAITDAKAADTKAGNAQTAANNAQSKADEAHGIASTNKTAIEGIQSAGYITIDPVNSAKAEVLGTAADTADKNTVYGAKAAAAAAAAAASTADGKAVAAQTKADKAEGDAATAQSAADAAQARANEAYTLADGKTTMAAVEAKGYATQTEAQGYVNTAISGVNTTIGTLSDKVDGVETTANNALSRVNGGTMEADINMGSHKITGLATPTADTDAATKKFVEDTVAAGIASNDAMTFKGVVGGEGNLANLPTESVKKGDTYKVGAIGVYGPEGSTQIAKVGDLFINTAEDDATPVWAHISSGYEDDYLQKLGADAANGKIYLNDGVNDAATSGSVQFVSANSGLKLEVTADALGGAHVVTASFVWEEFPAKEA